MNPFGSGRLRLNGDPAVEHELAVSLERLNLIDARSDTDSSLSSSDLSPLDLELNHLLSLNSKTPSAKPATLTPPQPQPDDDGSNEPPFIKIGSGACATVLAQPGAPFAVKLSKADHQEALWNDYLRHAKLAKCFAWHGFDDVRMPACHYFVPPWTPRFVERQPAFRDAARRCRNVPTSALVTERIPPLPPRARELLIERFCVEGVKEEARRDVANEDCLVRVYLGSTGGKTGQRFFSLRDLKMHLNHMMELQLDVRALARGVGMALALMHWAAETDSRDVEFVLGSSIREVSLARDAGKLDMLKPLTYTGPPSGRHEDFFRRVETTRLWVLDFDQVRPITMDEDGVAQAVDAAMANDPYIPKPLQESADEREVWKAFAVSYLEAGKVILEGEDDDVSELPLRFIEGLVEKQREKQTRMKLKSQNETQQGAQC
ncbi:hypothetical protein NEMBOFW57_007441 [Staphylotrichum longicolle]|uniref:DUF3669 domain-containing protein n=1 Tax=Staphylotrichum longicolle TaxID=669026 RepID=A0AAD4EUM6_9PEZI|nr:hypothetical protein NEMBOFW57_007441 [Staphylotrichum longicolle]